MTHRISNQALLRLLQIVVHLGSFNVSSRLFVEACRERGLSVNESHFLHFDTLFDYGFLTVKEQSAVSAGDIDSLQLNEVKTGENWDMQFSMTQNGFDFFHRFGVV